MARKKPANADYLKKAPTEVHTGFAEYISATTGTDSITPETVGLVQRLYPLYLKSPAVVKARESEKAARDAEKAAKDAEKRARAQARLDRLDEQRAKLLASLGITDDEPEDEPSVTFEVTPEPESVDEPEEVTVVEEDDDDEDEWDDDDDDDDDEAEDF